MINEKTWLKNVLDDVRKSRHKDTKNIKKCCCCGQLRPYPTEPGEWEYSEDVYFANPTWIRVSVKLPERDDEEGQYGLRLWKDGKIVWWPTNSAWRKIND